MSKDQTRSVAPLAPTVAQIRAWHRKRTFAMDQRKRADLALGAFLRSQLGWSRALPKADADRIAKQANTLIAFGEKAIKAAAKGKDAGEADPLFSEWSAMILASIQGRSHWDAIEAAAVSEMERLATSLPAWSAFGEAVKGFGPRSLAVIVGEAGDLALYSNPAKLWKRMGLAVMDGVRQGGLRKTSSKEDWIAHGYNAHRRSQMFVIGDVLIKNKGIYRDVYLAEKTRQRSLAADRGLTVAPAAKIPAKRKDEFMSDGHVHRRAQRYMEKRLLKNLWQAWRRANMTVETIFSLPAANSQRQTKQIEPPHHELSASRSASPELQPKDRGPSAPIHSGKVRPVKRRAEIAVSTVTNLPAAIPSKTVASGVGT